MTHPFNAYFELSEEIRIQEKEIYSDLSYCIDLYDNERNDNDDSFPTYPLSHPSFNLIPCETLKEALQESTYDSHNPTLAILGYFIAKNQDNLAQLENDLKGVKEALSQQDLLTLAKAYFVYFNPNIRPNLAPFYSIHPPKETLITFINTLLSFVDDSNEEKKYLKAKLITWSSL